MMIFPLAPGTPGEREHRVAMKVQPPASPTPPKLPVHKLLDSARLAILGVGAFQFGAALFFVWAMPHFLPEVDVSTQGDIIRYSRMATGIIVFGFGLFLRRRPTRFAGFALMIDLILEVGIHVAYPETFQLVGMLPQVLMAMALVSAWDQARRYEKLATE